MYITPPLLSKTTYTNPFSIDLPLPLLASQPQLTQQLQRHITSLKGQMKYDHTHTSFAAYPYLIRIASLLGPDEGIPESLSKKGEQESWRKKNSTRKKQEHHDRKISKLKRNKDFAQSIREIYRALTHRHSSHQSTVLQRKGQTSPPQKRISEQERARISTQPYRGRRAE